MSDWIEWKGGKCTLDKKDVVNIRFRDGTEGQDIATKYCWHHMMLDKDIIEYQLVHRWADDPRKEWVLIKDGCLMPEDGEEVVLHFGGDRQWFATYRGDKGFLMRRPATYANITDNTHWRYPFADPEV